MLDLYLNHPNVNARPSLIADEHAMFLTLTHTIVLPLSSLIAAIGQTRSSNDKLIPVVIKGLAMMIDR